MTVVFCLSTMLYYLITLPTLPVRGSSVPPQSESLFLIIFNSSISVPLSHHSGLSYHSFLSAHNNAILFYHNAPLSHHTGLLSHNDIPFSHHNSPTSCHHTVLFITVYHCLITIFLYNTESASSQGSMVPSPMIPHPIITRQFPFTVFLLPSQHATVPSQCLIVSQQYPTITSQFLVPLQW